MKRIGLRQDIPARAKREARSKFAVRKIDEARALSASAKLDVRRAAALAWIDVWAAQTELTALAALRAQAASAAELAAARVSGGAEPVADALATEVAVLEVDNRIESVRARRAVAQAGLSRWLGDAVAALFARDESQAPPVVTDAPPGQSRRAPDRPRDEAPTSTEATEAEPDTLGAGDIGDALEDAFNNAVDDAGIDAPPNDADPAPGTEPPRVPGEADLQRLRDAARRQAEDAARTLGGEARQAAEAQAARFLRDAERLAERAAREADPAIREDLDRAAREARRQAERLLAP